MGVPTRCIRAALAVAMVALTPAQGTGNQSTSVQPGSKFSSGDRVPMLQFLALRCADRPIDLRPRFLPAHYVYTAVLDFAAGSFAIDAIPGKHMTLVDGAALQSTKLIAPGDVRRSDVVVRDRLTQAVMQYTITIKRLNGKDSLIRALETPGASVTPDFDPHITDYGVRLAADQDNLNLRFVPWDTGQTFQIRAGPADSNQSTTQGGKRRLDFRFVPRVPPGEVQYTVIKRSFPIDVGQSRVVTITVQSANGDTSLKSAYRLRATRALCPAHRPYYAPDMSKCSVTCNEGYFGEASPAHRCKACAPHCLKCAAWNACQLCEPIVWRALHIVRLSHGRCQLVDIPWLQISEGLAALVISLSVCLCCYAYCCMDSSRGRRKGARRADRMEDGPQSHRLLRSNGEDSEVGPNSDDE